MHCVNCPLCPSEEDDCSFFDEQGVEFKDGCLGCRQPYNKLKKLSDEYDEYYRRMGTDMGQQYEFERLGVDKAKVIELCKHMVGLDNKKPYHRHGKAFYVAYRNYFDAPPEGNKYLDSLGSFICDRGVFGDKDVLYNLTEEGIDWLGRMLNITIKRG